VTSGGSEVSQRTTQPFSHRSRQAANDAWADGMRFESTAALRLNFMHFIPRPDRRQGRITVQQLRRDLREADEDRFRLTSALRLRRSSNGIIGVLFLLVAAFISALWTSRGPAPAVELVSAATPEVVAPAIVAPSGGPIEATVVNAAVVKKPLAKPRRQIRRSTSNSRGQLVPVRTVERPLRRVERPVPMVEPPLRRVSRPLHPGEFGRVSR
jgi:hypothetical protein